VKNNVGNPVEGEDFFDRVKEQAKVWRKLESSHLLMLAPRRIGKTSLIFRLRDTAHEHGFKAACCSFAKCESEHDCIKLLINTVNEKMPSGKKFSDALKSMASHISGINIGMDGLGIEWDQSKELDWQAAGEALGQILDEFGEPWLICVDELPVFIINLLKQGDNGKQRARTFLYWLRDLRQQHYKQVKWLMAGSIGLDTLAARLGLSDTINDVEPFPLSAFDEATALDFLDRLAQSYDLPLSLDLRQAIVHKVGWPVPYYLQLMFSQLRDEWADTGTPPDTTSIDRAFDRLLDPAYRVHFDYWRQRLDEELDRPDADYAALLLNAISKDPNGMDRSHFAQILLEKMHEAEERDKMLSYLLEVLAGDGYLTERESRYAFRLEWLRVYWQRRFAA
jgi:hypothetical protein